MPRVTDSTRAFAGNGRVDLHIHAIAPAGSVAGGTLTHAAYAVLSPAARVGAAATIAPVGLQANAHAVAVVVAGGTQARAGSAGAWAGARTVN